MKVRSEASATVSEIRLVLIVVYDLYIPNIDNHRQKYASVAAVTLPTENIRIRGTQETNSLEQDL